MTISGVHSQKSSTNDETRKYITAKERDSIFSKIQRGKSDALKVIALKRSLVACGNTKAVYNKVIKVHVMKADSLSLIIAKQKEIETNLVLINKLQLKESKKRSRNSFLKGSAVGIILTAVVAGILTQ